MKTCHYHSDRKSLNQAAFCGFPRVVLALLSALLLFFLLSGLSVAQEAGQDAGAQEATPVLSEQAIAAAVAAAQPATTGEAPAQQPLSRELRTDRLWLLPRHSAFTDLIRRAGRQALQHPDCNEVLYGSLNEFRTERTGTSFTILCMRDARTTFNLVFFADDLLSEEELNAAEEPASSIDELERLRQMMLPQTAPNAAQPAEPIQSEAESAELPAPVVF
ncbi:MAG: hypothetical protein Q7W55_16405 [Pseudohongiella sp.]|nr:hypothetical protein [Pseudohongiella sp.]MDO9520258.1 hypothetical protein [Pseudohongiella sp.]MDP2127063.1 hypothetical protein [Pseudohongiella sp.]